MKYAKLLEAGRAMTAEERDGALRSLCSDARFGAVAVLLAEQKELAADGSCELKFADHHGCLAHAAGVRYGLREVEGRLKQVAERVVKRGLSPAAKLMDEG